MFNVKRICQIVHLFLALQLKYIDFIFAHYFDITNKKYCKHIAQKLLHQIIKYQINVNFFLSMAMKIEPMTLYLYSM